jgi:flagellar hook protein FlgE
LAELAVVAVEVESADEGNRSAFSTGGWWSSRRTNNHAAEDHMRLTGLYAGREALMAQGTAINAVADNLANFNTPGFKAERSEFENILADSQGSLFGSPLETGNGAQVADLRTLYDKQGTFDFTDRGSDMAIDGKGFFNISDGTDTYYTRAGNFTIDKSGNLVTSDGLFVLGIPATTGDDAGASEGTPTKLNVNDVAGKANASTKITVGGNLDTSSKLFNGTTGLPAAGASYNQVAGAADFASPVTVVDSLGKAHDLSLYFFHSGPTEYTVRAYVDGADVGSAPNLPFQVGETKLTFQSDGSQGTGAASTLAINAPWGDGAQASTISADLSKFTGFASPSALSNVEADGNRAGSPTGVEVETDGTFNVVLDNGDRTKVGTIVLSAFQNVDGLERSGGNKFRATDEVGDISTGAGGAEGRGGIRGGALENSTVDPAGEFIDLVRFQRGYQAGSQVITTISQLLNTTINIKS